MSGDDQTVDLTGEPASRLQSAVFYALKELAPGQSVVLVTAQEPTLMMQSLDLQLGHKLAWAITEADARWRVGRVQPGTLQSWNPQRSQAGGRIPSSELGVQQVATVDPYVDSVLATERAHRRHHDSIAVHHTARRPPAPLHLNH